MEYGILIVEGAGVYHVIGSVANIEEARELAESYNRWASPGCEADPDMGLEACEEQGIPAEEYVIVRRDTSGFYGIREPFYV